MNSISDEIYKSIEAQIVNGKLRSGDKLPSENELCKLWNTSRISVRQALERMMVLGILKKVRGGGTYVSEPDASVFLSPLLAFAIFREESVKDILVFRNIIEVGSVKLCALYRNQDNLNKLKRCIIEMDSHCTPESSVRMAEFDLEFHMEIARGSKNPLNVKIHEMLRHTLRQQQINLNSLLGSLKITQKEHHNIYNAIEEQDAELAAHFMQRHIQRIIGDLDAKK
jgi:GntR family transcriptional repressor for pyruvate dehydrogenase complex